MQEISLSDTARWYCAITRPNRLEQAERELAALNYRAFTPKHRRWVTHARVRKAKERSLLGRYLFVEVDHPNQSFGAVTALHSIDSLVSMDGNPCAFPAAEVEDLFRRYLAGEWDEVEKGRLPIGARIRLLEGQFDNMLATVTRMKGSTVTFKLVDSRTYGSALNWNVRAA